MEQNRSPGILIVGAGLSGLATGERLATVGESVTILEARDRIGGRAWTRRPAGLPYPIELGAEWIDAGGAAPDWQSDPFGRGSYTYVLVGGIDAWKTLARPLEQTLYFAGDATGGHGYNATMEGAIVSGRRAALELLKS